MTGWPQVQGPGSYSPAGQATGAAVGLVLQQQNEAAAE
jgi:hypothetical protein